MSNPLSLYREKDSWLHRLNPLTKLTLSLAIIILGLLGPWVWSAMAVVFVVILPLIVTGKLLGEYLGFVLKILLPTVLFMFLMQSIFIPGGKTEILKVWIFTIELETVQRAFVITSKLFLVVSSFVVMLFTTHPGRLMSDLTKRGLPPQFAYVLIATLQLIPQVQAKANTIIAAQRSRGLETQGHFFRRVGSLVPLVGPLVIGSLVEVEERAIAIEARGFTSMRPKTILNEIPDTSTDKRIRRIVIALVILALFLRLWLS